jgi:hypothetical protein
MIGGDGMKLAKSGNTSAIMPLAWTAGSRSDRRAAEKG